MTPALQQSAAMVVLHVDEAHHNIMSAALLFSALGAVRAGVESATSWSRNQAPFHFAIAQLPSGDFRLVAELMTVPKAPASRPVPKAPASRPPPPGTMPKAKAPPGTTPKAKGVPEVKAMPKSKAASKTTPKAKGASEVKAVKLATTPKASTWTAQRSLKRSLRLTSTSSYEPHDENSMYCT